MGWGKFKSVNGFLRPRLRCHLCFVGQSKSHSQSKFKGCRNSPNLRDFGKKSFKDIHRKGDCNLPRRETSWLKCTRWGFPGGPVVNHLFQNFPPRPKGSITSGPSSHPQLQLSTNQPSHLPQGLGICCWLESTSLSLCKANVYGFLHRHAVFLSIA